ncbi:hypothetical protein QBC43DRAFT_122552 [Cladorrhinum sp. PSN259]|nr:hypothetical protein QBC43DRAFT_122552 [Cladorrhinum sp. PSN259]
MSPSPPATPLSKQYAPLIPSPLNPVSSPSSCPTQSSSCSPKPKSHHLRPASQISPTNLLLRQKAAAAFRYHKSTTAYQNYVPLGSRRKRTTFEFGFESKSLRRSKSRHQLVDLWSFSSSPSNLLDSDSDDGSSSQKKDKLVDDEKKTDDDDDDDNYSDLDLKIWNAPVEEEEEDPAATTTTNLIHMIKSSLLDFDDDNGAGGDLGLLSFTSTTLSKEQGLDKRYCQDAEEREPMLCTRQVVRQAIEKEKDEEEEEEEEEDEKSVLWIRGSTRRERRGTAKEERTTTTTTSSSKITLRRVTVLVGILVVFVLVHGLVSTFGPGAEGRKGGEAGIFGFQEDEEVR